MDIFTPDNTRWEISHDEYGHIERNLVYTGDLGELAEETGKTEDELYELLGEYEDESLEALECEYEIEKYRKGMY